MEENQLPKSLGSSFYDFKQDSLMENPMISIVIPIYNEEGNIGELYKRIDEALIQISDSVEIIFVNDGSRDRSGLLLNELAAQDKNVKIIHFRRNMGQTAAMVAGVDLSSGDIIVPMDGDLQNDPKDIKKLIDKINEGYDVVSGWRKERKDKPIKRNFLSRVANFIISRVSGVHLHDYGCSLKAYRKDVIKGVKLYGEMHRFIPIYATWMGARVTEVPVAHFPRVHGVSKYGMERIIKVVLDLMVVQFLYKYSTKPMYVFGGFGLLNFAISIFSGALALYFKFFANISLIQTPLPLLVVMTFVTGTMCILMGFLAELAIRTYYESQNKTIYLIDKIIAQKVNL